MILSLRFENNDTGHGDLVLTLEAESWICNSYYLALDQQTLPQQSGVGKIGWVLKKLLEQWLSVVERLEDGGRAFLPYDFSDQYTGWIRCIRYGDTVETCRGWTAAVEGWAVSPSAVGNHLSDVPGFKRDGDIHQLCFEELTKTVRDLLGQYS